MPAKSHVIIGGGPAGLYAIETIRELEGGESSITLISDEPPYARMALPYLIAGEIPEEHLMTGSGEGHFKRLKVNALFGRRATSIDVKGKTVSLNDGAAVSFDDLLIATGASPTAIKIPGVNIPGVQTLWTLDDAKKALAKARRGADVTFIGAGFIGFIILNAMYKRGCRLSVVELEDQILPRMLDSQSGEMVERWLTKRGVGVYTGVSARAIEEGREGRKILHLTDDRTLTADLVIVGTGIRPNIELVQGSGIRTAWGILVNDRMQTNFSYIYAAGDVPEGRDLCTGESTVHAIQPTAEDHGRVAGANMAGKEVRYQGSLLMNILDVCGLHCSSFGLWKADNLEAQALSNPSHPLYRKLVWNRDVLVGAILVGPAEDTSMLNDLGMIKGLIETKVSMGKWKAYLHQNPLDLRRPYVASGAATKLLRSTLLGKRSWEKKYRYRNMVPETRPSDSHGVFVRTMSS